MIRQLLIIILFLSLLSCSNKRKELVGHIWNITEGTYRNQKIEFKNTDQIQIINLDGSQKVDLYFSKKRKIFLPGINSSNIRANWSIKNDSIKIELDTLKYNYIHRKIDSTKISNKDFFGNDLGLTREEAILKSIEFTNRNPIKTNEFGLQMNIYGNTFLYLIENDILILTSKTTRIIAKKDKTIENLLNNSK